MHPASLPPAAFVQRNYSVSPMCPTVQTPLFFSVFYERPASISTDKVHATGTDTTPTAALKAVAECKTAPQRAVTYPNKKIANGGLIDDVRLLVVQVQAADRWK
jgi:hypothetical protein